MESNSWKVSQEESGTTLLLFLKSKLPVEYSSRKLKQAIENNLCEVNSRTERFATFIVGVGDEIKFHDSLEPISQDGGERILYEDDDLLFYNKPSNMPSDSPLLLQQLQKRHKTCQLVHRLDRDTTGVLLFAKNESTYKALLDLFKKKAIDKTYLAIVDGEMKKQAGVISNYLGEKHRYEGQVLWGEVKSGLQAITEWQVIKKGAQATLLCCYPKTGRTHQLRVHLSGLGHPILGDYQYGRHFRCNYRPPRYLLHAEALAFVHPTTGKLCQVSAPLPEDFQKAAETLFGKVL